MDAGQPVLRRQAAGRSQQHMYSVAVAASTALIASTADADLQLLSWMWLTGLVAVGLAGAVSAAAGMLRDRRECRRLHESHDRLAAKGLPTPGSMCIRRGRAAAPAAAALP